MTIYKREKPPPIVSTSPVVILAAILVALVLAGCGRDGESGGFGFGGASDEIDFGDDYGFATAQRETEADEPPVVQNDSLHVWVRYAGGCEDHDFTLGHLSRGDTARVWLRHDARGDECEADFVERLQIRLPDAVLGKPHIRLLDPSGETPLIVNQ